MSGQPDEWLDRIDLFLKKFKDAPEYQDKFSKSYPFLFQYVEDPDFPKDLVRFLNEDINKEKSKEAIVKE
jgi:hypothetical protein